jgi:hypothetical protein
MAGGGFNFGKFCWEIIVWQCLSVSVCLCAPFILTLFYCCNVLISVLSSFYHWKRKRKKRKTIATTTKKKRMKKRITTTTHAHTHSNRSINYLNTQSFLRKGGVTAPSPHWCLFFLFLNVCCLSVLLSQSKSHTKLRQPNTNTATKNKIKKSN